MSKRLLIKFALLLWWVVPTQAQLTLSLPNVNADPGDQIEVAVEVENFIDITTIQFSFHWDPAVLQFVDTTEVNLVDASNLLINLNDTLDGFLRFFWFQFDLTGENLADGAALMKMKFNVIGENGTFSPLDINDDPLPYLAGDAHTNGAIPATQNNGMVTVGTPDGISGPERLGKLTLYPNQPNPFRDNTLVQFDLTEAEYITFKLFDLSGKKILEQSQLYPAGSQYITLEQHQLPSAGTYLYQLQAGPYLLTKKLSLVR